MASKKQMNKKTKKCVAAPQRVTNGFYVGYDHALGKHNFERNCLKWANTQAAADALLSQFVQALPTRAVRTFCVATDGAPDTVWGQA